MSLLGQQPQADNDGAKASNDTDYSYLTVNDGTQTHDSIPISTNWVDRYSKSQFILPADQLQNMQGTYIWEMTFYFSQETNPWGDATFEVYMDRTAETEFTEAEFDWHMTKVKDEADLSVSNYMMVVSFDRPYYYESGNLKIGFKQVKRISYINVSGYSWYGVDTDVNNAIAGYQNTQSWKGIKLQQFMPKITFTYKAPDCRKPYNVSVTDVTSSTATIQWINDSDSNSEVDLIKLEYNAEAFNVGFEGGVLPSDWTNEGTTPYWNIRQHGGHSGSMYYANITHSNTFIVSPPLNMATCEPIEGDALYFWYRNRPGGGNLCDGLGVYARSQNDEGQWQEWEELWKNEEGDYHNDWTEMSITGEAISGAVLDGNGIYQIGFSMPMDASNANSGVDLDDIVLYANTTELIDTWEVDQSVQTYTFTGLEPETEYVSQVKNLCQTPPLESDWIYFTTTEVYNFNKDISKYTSDNDHYYLIASPIGTVNPESVNNMLSNSYDLYYFDQEEESEWVNYEDENYGNFSLEPGKGYLYANSGDGANEVTTLTFTGNPYNGNGQIPLIYNSTAEFNGWNLIGNPYTTSAEVDKPYYRLNTTGSELNATTESTAVEAMEGVFVKATETGQTATFSVATSKGNHISQLNLNVTKGRGSVIDCAIVRFDGGSTLPKFQLHETSTKVYIPQGNEDFAVISSNKDGELPVNFKAETNDSYTLTVVTEDVEMDYLHLIDNLTGNDIDLLKTPSYTFEANTTDYESRFKLVYSIGPSTGSETFAFYDGTEWVITEKHAGATVQIIDVTGRIVFSRDGVHTVSTNQMAPGVYVMRLISNSDVKTQKIVVR